MRRIRVNPEALPGKYKQQLSDDNLCSDTSEFVCRVWSTSMHIRTYHAGVGSHRTVTGQPGQSAARRRNNISVHILRMYNFNKVETYLKVEKIIKHKCSILKIFRNAFTHLLCAIVRCVYNFVEMVT